MMYINTFESLMMWFELLVWSLLRRDGRSLENFLEDYFAGRLKRYVKSEPVPAKNNAAVKVSETHVFNVLDCFIRSSLTVWYQVLTQADVCGQVVVADTFEEIVNDPEKDVLIEFYAPWCGHCKKLEPKYTELGERVSITWHLHLRLNHFSSCVSVFYGLSYTVTPVL